MAGEQKRGGGSLLPTLLIFALAGVVLWLLAERNTRTWYLVPEDGRLMVVRGANLPFGRRALNPTDPNVAAYAPITSPTGAKLPEEQSFDSQSGLDQAIFTVLDGWAKSDVASGSPEKLAQGIEYVRRAEKLTAISSSQREELVALEAESGYFEAQTLLEKAAKELKDATDQLRAAAHSRSPHATDAQALLNELEPNVNGVLSAARGAALIRPPAPPVPATPAPPPQMNTVPPPAPPASTP